MKGEPEKVKRACVRVRDRYIARAAEVCGRTSGPIPCQSKNRRDIWRRAVNGRTSTRIRK